MMMISKNDILRDPTINKNKINRGMPEKPTNCLIADNKEMQSTDKSDSNDEDEEEKSKFPSKTTRKRRDEKIEMEKDKVKQKRLWSLLFGTISDQQLTTKLGNQFYQFQGENAKKNDVVRWFMDKTIGSQVDAYEK